MFSFIKIQQCSDIASVRQVLADNDWKYLCEGDWAWIYLSDDGQFVARLCYFDPAYRLYLDCCLQHSDEIHLPATELIHDMPNGSYVAVMKYYRPYDREKAQRLCQLLEKRDSSDLPGHMKRLHSILMTLHDQAKKKLYQFGKFDLRPEHIMMDRQGRFIVLDPIFVDGRKLVQSMQKDLASVLTHYSVDELSNFLKIAAMGKKLDDPVVNQLHDELIRVKNQ